MWLQLIFSLTPSSFWLVKCLFGINEQTTSNLNYLKVSKNLLCCVYCLNQPLWKVQGIAKINFHCFTIDKSNQVKLFRKIMQCNRNFIKIALETRLVANWVFVFFEHFFQLFKKFEKGFISDLDWCRSFLYFQEKFRFLIFSLEKKKWHSL